jgi:hypothetical protein
VQFSRSKFLQVAGFLRNLTDNFLLLPRQTRRDATAGVVDDQINDIA